MRKLDEELMRLIRFAEADDNIRAMVLQGSFVNDNAPKDIFSDLDPLFYCTDVTPFITDDKWRSSFGDVIARFDDEWPAKDGEKAYTRLTLYRDGFKIDFGFQSIKLAQYANDMELYKVYVDKDGIVPKPDVTDERKFYLSPPTEREYQDVLRDFFFDSSYVVKTIYRDEVTFNQYMIHILHKKILKLAEWYIGCQHDFQVNTGIHGRYLKRYLSADEYNHLKQTYAASDHDDVRRALMTSFDLVRYFGMSVASNLGFEYPEKLERDMRAYCEEWMSK